MIYLYNEFPPWIWLFVFIYGAIFGSFFNVLIYRIPRHRSFIARRSQCPYCKNFLGFEDMVPIASYFYLKGACRNCNNPISRIYPLVEFLTAVWMCILFYWLIIQKTTVFGLANNIVIISLFLLFIPLAVIDIKHQLIPDLFTLPGLAIGFLVSLFPGPITPVQSLLGIIAGGLPLFLVGWLGEKLFKKEEAMGGGDIKMMAAVGALLGPQTVLMALALGSVMGSVIGITLMLFKKLNKDRKIPFGPYLALGSVLAFFYGDRLLELYMRWIGTLVK